MATMERIRRGTALWVPAGEGRFGLAEVTRRDGALLQVELLDGSGKSFSLDLDDRDIAVLKANAALAEDMTALRHLHLPGILHNLRERSLEDCPYTFLGSSVLVAVNPLRRVADPPGILGERNAVNVPHPYAIAEAAFQQLCFAAGNRRSNTPANQSVLVSGESGAGKTECSKMVLKHLVARCLESKSKDDDLDRRLLDSTPILEAFGNAATKRNHNSSRFGKFLKLHFERKKGRATPTISGASVETYLLERSRVTSHGEGERTFHIFYRFLSGASKAQKVAYELNQPFAYLFPRSRNSDSGGPARGRGKGRGRGGRGDAFDSEHTRSIRLSLEKLQHEDKSQFNELCTALETVGIPREHKSDPCQEHLFAIIAALLHLGNVIFEDDSSGTEGNVAVIKDSGAINKAAELLGVKPKELRKLFIERKVTTVGEVIITKRDALTAKDALDAVVKTIYVRLFEWLVRIISVSLGGVNDGGGRSKAGKGGKKAKAREENFIGVLDIFGFESFAINDFEQLLINYTNEALQSSFNKQIFEAEAELYSKEGLLVDSEEREPPMDNSLCMELMRGSTNSMKGAGKKLGVLGVIDAEGKAPQPLDDKMNAALHRNFKGHPNFVAPHPRDVRTTFIIKHFAGTVRYTVGRFLEKNSDRVPIEVDDLFSTSSTALVVSLFELPPNKSKDSIATAKRTVRGINNSIIARFKSQIDKLITTLDDTRCSFVRCVKPNPHMLREDGHNWFDDAYVTNQLENLSIPQTTQVLRGGLPTRIPYEVLVDLYVKILPDEAIRVWKTCGVNENGQPDDRAFVAALFFAFEVDSSTYKMGLTRVFFKAGMLERLTHVLDTAASGTVDSVIVDRFRSSFTRHLWRRAYAKVLAINRFTELLEFCRSRNSAVTILQRVARRRLAELNGQAQLARLREEKRKQEEVAQKKRAKDARKKQKDAKKKADDAEAKKLREAELLRLEEEQAAAEAALEEERHKAAAEEQERVRQYRAKVEKEEKLARKREKEETKKAIEMCGGEEAYLKQKERERVHFNEMVTVQEYEMYLTDEHMEPPGDEDDYYAGDAKVMRTPTPDLRRVASDLKVVHRPPEDPIDRRRSYAPSVARKVAAEDDAGEIYFDGALIAMDGIVEEELAASRPRSTGSEKKLWRAGGKLKCLISRGSARARQLNQRRQQFRRRSRSAPYDWQRCFISLKGFSLNYFADSMSDGKGDRIGVRQLGKIQITGIKSIKHFKNVEADGDERLKASIPVDDIDPRKVIKLMHVKGHSFLIYFPKASVYNDWNEAIKSSMKRWRSEVQAMRKFEKGDFKADAMEEYRKLLNEGVISKKDFHFALGQQVSTELEYVEQAVALYGEYSYDKRVICDECREVNFLLEGDSDGSFWCHGCNNELFLDGRKGPSLPSLLQPFEPEEDTTAPEEVIVAPSHYPVSINLSDGSMLTVYQGELVGRPRFDVKTRTRQFYFSFRCQFEDKKSKSGPRYWSIDFPFPSFRYLHQRVVQDFESKGVDMALPDFPERAGAAITDVKEQARVRLPYLNVWMENLLLAAKAEDLIFRSPSLRYFFNLKSSNIQVSPLSLSELEELKDTFSELSEFAMAELPLTKEVFGLYRTVQNLYSRIEASSDESVVFSTTDAAIVELPLQKKGELFSLASDYMDVLEHFEHKYLREIKAMGSAANKPAPNL